MPLMIRNMLCLPIEHIYIVKQPWAVTLSTSLSCSHRKNNRPLLCVTIISGAVPYPNME